MNTLMQLFVGMDFVIYHDLYDLVVGPIINHISVLVLKYISFVGTDCIIYHHDKFVLGSIISRHGP